MVHSSPFQCAVSGRREVKYGEVDFRAVARLPSSVGPRLEAEEPASDQRTNFLLNRAQVNKLT